MTDRANLTHVLFLAVIIPGVLVCSPSAVAVDFEFIKIVDTNTVIPGHTATFGSLSVPSLDGGHLAFWGGGPIAGLYSFTDSLSMVADTNTPIPAGTGNFDYFNYPLVDGDSVAFYAQDSSNRPGIYKHDGKLSMVADYNTPIPQGSGNFFNFSNPPGEDGKLVFQGSGSGQQGIYASEGSLSRVVDLTMNIPSGSGKFTSLGQPFIGGYNVAFLGAGNGQEGVYNSFFGTLTRIADLNTPIPSGTGNFSDFDALSADGDYVAFRASGNGGQRGIYYTGSDGMKRLADLNTPVPGGTGNFTALGFPSFDGGAVAFAADGTGQEGVYTNLDGSLGKVVDLSDSLDGKTLSNLYFNTVSQGISDRNMAFLARFDDNSQAIYVAASQHRWGSGTTGSWMTASNWRFGFTPQNVFPTLITPEEGTVVTGPHAPVQLHSLTLGATNSGTAELRVKPTGQITIDEELHIQEGGKLYIDGVVTYRDVPDRGFQTYGEIELANGAQFNGASYMENYGLVRGDGQIDHMFWNHGTGEVRVGTGEHLRLGSGNEAAFNLGRMEVIGGELEFSGRLRNISGPPAGAIYARNATLRFGIALENLSTVGFSFGTSDVFGDVENITEGAYEGTINVSGNSQVTFWDDFNNGGALNISPGSTAVVFGFSGNGHKGGGTLFVEGDLRPGSSPGHSIFDGDLVLGALAGLEIELGGTLLGTEYDKVTVTGDLAANGTLDVLLTDVGEGLFSPKDGDTFDILDWGTLNGTFQNVNLPGLSPALFWDSSQLYVTGELMVTAVPEPSTIALVLSGVVVGAGLLRRRKKVRVAGA